jgi:preprotein translocase subunit YajC
MSPFFPLFAQAAAPAAGGGMQALLLQFLAIGAVWYFLWIRPQQKQRKQHQEAILALKKGDEVVTSGGLVGEVVFVKESLKDGQPVRTLDDRVTIRSGESKIVIERGRIAKISTAGGAETKA